MKITLTLDVPSALKFQVEAAVEAMLRTLPASAKAEWTETSKRPLATGGLELRTDGPTPIERAIDAVADAAGEG